MCDCCKNEWKAKYCALVIAMRGACKGISRLKRKYAELEKRNIYLMEVIADEQCSCDKEEHPETPVKGVS